MAEARLERDIERDMVLHRTFRLFSFAMLSEEGMPVTDLHDDGLPEFMIRDPDGYPMFSLMRHESCGGGDCNGAWCCGDDDSSPSEDVGEVTVQQQVDDPGPKMVLVVSLSATRADALECYDDTDHWRR